MKKNLKIYFIIGLSGSGKSSLVRNKFSEYIKEYGDNVTIHTIDDYGSNLSRFGDFDILKRSKTEMNVLFISSHMLTDDDILKESLELIEKSFEDIDDFEIEKIYFKNDFPQCCKNLIWRDGINNSYRMNTVNYRISQKYNPPSNAISVYRADTDEEVEKKIAKKMRNFVNDWNFALKDDSILEKEKVLNYYGHIIDRARTLYCLGLIDNKKKSRG